MRLTTYTAIFGTIPDQLQVPFPSPDVRYIAYVDNPDLKSPGGWELHPPLWHHRDPRRRARWHKINAHLIHPDSEYTLWVDGCLTPIQDPATLPGLYLGKHDVCVFEHAQRTCLYQELEACLKLRKDAPEAMRTQVGRYEAEGYPRGRGLAETTAVLRRHTAASEAWNDAWWREIMAGSLRDQLSFNYVGWKLNSSYAVFVGSRTRCPHFAWRAHR